MAKTILVDGREIEDDGTLRCLGLDTDKGRKFFSCPSKQQSELVGQRFELLDFFSEIKGMGGKEKYIFKARTLGDNPSVFKVWTGSPDIFVVLDKLRELDLFPRVVTLRKKNNGSFYFE